MGQNRQLPLMLFEENNAGVCSILWYARGCVFKFVQFAPGSCSQTFNRFNVVKHFAG